MPCQSYDNSWDRDSDDREKIRALKKQADMLARIACKALTELEKNQIEDMILLRDDEVRVWWAKHKEDDRKEQARLAEVERKKRVREEALNKLSTEERELLGLAPTVAHAKRLKTKIVPARAIVDQILNKYDEEEDEDS